MDKFLQYDHADFAMEDSFINWVKTRDENDQQFWEQWTREHPEKKSEIEKAILLVQSLKFKEKAVPQGKEDSIWANIVKETSTDESSTSPVKETVKEPVKKIKLKPDFEQEREQERNKKGSFRIVLAAIASLAAALLFFFWINQGSGFDSQHSTQLAETINLELPGGSTIQLNAESKVAYNKKTWENNRVVELEGEAFFDVKKGAKFTVETKYGTVEVLGTSFNVFARKDHFNVLCETGRVAVISDQEKTVLKPNQSVTLIEGKQLKNENVLKDKNRALWRSGVYHYDAAPISKVIADAERHLGIEVKWDDQDSDLKFTGSFMGKDKEKVLTQICYPLNLNFEIKGHRVLLRKK